MQFGSTHKNHEMKDFVDQVKKLFRVNHDTTAHFSSLSSGISDSLVESFSSTSNHLIDNHIDPFQGYLVQSGNSNLFDFSTTQTLGNTSGCSSGLEQNMSGDYEDMLNTQDFTSLINQSEYKAQASSVLLTMEDLFRESDFTKSISNPGPQYDLSWWLSPHPDTDTADLSHSTGLTPSPNLSGNNSPIHMSGDIPSNPIQGLLTDVLNSTDLDIKDHVTFGTDKLFSTWDETLVPSETRNPNNAFYQLGIGQLIDVGGITGASSCSFAKYGFEDQFLASGAAKRRKIDGFSSNKVNNEGVFSFEGKVQSLNLVFDPKTSDVGLDNEALGSCIVDACNSSSSERQYEQVKTPKKKAKSGTKPRPKDRQMIQDRLAELRELIPCGDKMSIDRLLERTIRHLNFTQSLTKHAESLKQIDKQKSIEVSKSNSNKNVGGVTWACDVRDEAMVCPLIVEDLVTPGQMLIMIVCEEHGFFLEVADTIRGLGLTILKGATEVGEPKKIRARFLVQAEGTRRVSRHEILSSLVQLLEISGQSIAARF